MTNASYTPYLGGDESVAMRHGAGPVYGCTGGWVLRLRSDARRVSFEDRESRREMLRARAPNEPAEVFPSRKTNGAVLRALLVLGEPERLQKFPYSKNFCIRLTDSRAPPSIAG